MKLAIAIVLACAATAAAQPSSKQRADATAAYQEGQRRYLDEDYLGAAAQFEAAYKLDADPAYEFNIAQAYRLGKDCTKALFWYRKFLVDAPKAPNVDAVKRYIAEEEATCKDATPPIPPTTSSGPTAPAPGAGSGEPVHDTPPGGNHLKRNVGIGLVGLGAVGLVTGITFTVKTVGYNHDRENLCNPSPCMAWDPTLQKHADQLDHDGKRAQKLQWVGYGIGAAALGAGLWLIFSDAKTAESPVAIVPTRGGAFVSLTLSR